MKKLTVLVTVLFGGFLTIKAQTTKKEDKKSSESSNTSSNSTSNKRTYAFGDPNNQASLEAARKHNEENARREIQENRDAAAREGRPDPYAPKEKPVQATQQ